jgi:hypothetical protein
MAGLTPKKRDALSSAAFALPKERKFPIPDAAHAANAKSRATQGVNKGTLSPKAAAAIRKKANKILNRGKVKSDMDGDERGGRSISVSDMDGDE